MAHQFPPGNPTLISRTLELGEREGVRVYTATLSRAYDTSVHDLWAALTDAERLRRWVAPVTGELREGGRFQFEGNAGGTITRCVDREVIEATWEFSGSVSWVTVAVADRGDGTSTMTLTHTSPISPAFWERYGPGATGIGWDLALDGVAHDLPQESPDYDAEAFATSDAGHAFIATSSEAWATASIAGGTDAAAARAAQARCTTFFTGAPEPEG